jgi:hypothetical protein
MVQPEAEFANGCTAAGNSPWANEVAPPSARLAARTTAVRPAAASGEEVGGVVVVLTLAA